MAGEKYYISECPDTKQQFLVQYQKDGNIIELTSDNIEAIKKIGSEKTYIFLTGGGTAFDDSGSEIANCQFLAIAKGIDVLTAFNNMLSDESHSGQYDSCFAYELSDDKIKGSFDLSDNIPAECEDSECEDCTLSDDEKSDLDCPYVNN